MAKCLPHFEENPHIPPLEPFGLYGYKSVGFPSGVTYFTGVKFHSNFKILKLLSFIC